MSAASPRLPAPIFIVGSPRSGTTLLAAMVGAHPEVDCGPETRLLAQLEDRDLGALLDPAGWPERAADYVLGLALKESPVHELFGVDPETVRAYLAGRSPSVAALLESLTVPRALAHGKARWAEKTPRHAEAAETIRREWPDATIVRVVRDPRDVALSMQKVPFARDTLTAALGDIEAMERQADLLLRADPRTVTIRYEDLLADPEATLRTVGDAAGLAWDPAMLERRADAASIAAPHEWWKAKAGEPLDPSRIGVWRREMDPAAARYAAIHLRDHLRAHGYEGAEDPVATIAVVPVGRRLAVRFEPIVLACAAAGIDLPEPAPRQPAELGRCERILFWGQPGQIGLDLGSGAAERTVALARLALLLAGRRLRGRPALWVRRQSTMPANPGDPGERATARLLRLLARTVRPQEVTPALGLPHVALGGAEE